MNDILTIHDLRNSSLSKDEKDELTKFYSEHLQRLIGAAAEITISNGTYEAFSDLYQAVVGDIYKYHVWKPKNTDLSLLAALTLE